jgi:molybdate transport system substrate-binding protein
MPIRLTSHVIARLMAPIAVVLFSTSASAAELKVIAPNAVKEAVVEIAAQFEKETRYKMQLAWTGSEAISKRVADGEIFDVVVNTTSGIDALAKAGRLTANSKRNFSRSAVAVAVKAGVPKPDISTIDELKLALLKAESIAISSGASGRYLEQLFQKLGVSEAIKPKIKQPPSGAQIGDILARGEAELGFQQVTELIHAKGFQYVGTLPAEVQNYTVWSAAVHTATTQPDAAMAFVAAMTGPKAASAINTSGMEPAQ